MFDDANIYLLNGNTIYLLYFQHHLYYYITLLQGKGQRYTMILQQLRTGTDIVLSRIFRALAKCVGDISIAPSEHDELVTSALSIRFRPVSSDALQSLIQAQVALSKISTNVVTTTINIIITILLTIIIIIFFW